MKVRLCLCISAFCLQRCSILDIDECSQGTAGCNQGCNNTEGSFICTCNEGFRLHHNNLTFCVGMYMLICYFGWWFIVTF